MAEIKLVKHRERRGELLNLFRASFGFNISPELWDWKYLQNPLASDDPEIIVAVDNDRIIGARPLLLAELWLKDENIKAAQPCDTMVHPEHQREGIFSGMNRYAIQYFKENGYTLFYNFPNPKSRPGYIKQGWEIVSSAGILFRVVNPQKAISYALNNRVLGNGLGFLYDNLINRSAKATASSDSFHLKVFDHLNEELGEIDALRNRAVINVVRSKSYLSWRFDQHPEYSYKYIVAKKADELWGYTVSSVQRQPNGLVSGVIVDYVVRDENIECFRQLINEALLQLENLKPDLISIGAFHQPGFRRELVEHFGFKSSMKFPYNRFADRSYFVVRRIDERAAEKIDVYNKENWQLTYIYPDTT